jgi:hypothetical protein
VLTTSTSTIAPPRTSWHHRPALRWLVTFAGFPLGSVLARAVLGPIDATAAAVIGGAINGAVLGALQGWALRRTGLALLRWAAATSAGLAIGLGVGATLVDFSTTMGALVLQGAVCGLAVGAAQAVVLAPTLGRVAAIAWAVGLSALWAAGWAITTAIGVDVDERFTVFGSSGAIVVTALTAVLPLALTHRRAVA